MKSYGVTIQMTPLQQYFYMLLFIWHVVLTFESVDEILTSVIIQMKVYESINGDVYYAVQGRFDLLIL